LANIWKKIVIENLKSGNVSYTTVGEFLLDLKKEFGEGNNKIIKVTELKKVEQESRTIKEIVQKFRRVAKESRYERRLLVEEFKREMNSVIRRKLIEH